MTSRKDPPEIIDPASHFPYKAAQAKALVIDNPPMGPDGKDDGQVRAEDFLSREIVDATAAYVDAQAVWYRSPDVSTYAAMQKAAEILVSARRLHRANRVGMTVVGIRARRAGE